jgi:TctA family transporter
VGYVLGPLMEEYLRRALLLARGDASVFFTRPISLAFIVGTVLILISLAWPALHGRQSTR